MKRILTTLALAAAAMGCTPPAHAAIVLSFAPSTTAAIAIGEEIIVTATISGLGAEVLSTYDLNYLFNPGVLAWSSSDFLGGGLFGDKNQFGVFENGAGEPNGDPLADGNLGWWMNSRESDAFLAANQDDSFEVARFFLNGAANGTSQFTLGSDLDFERMFTGLNYGQLDVQVGSLCIAVGTGQCTVPEPASLGLVGIALLAAGVARRARPS
jgi:hypothetical protein